LANSYFGISKLRRGNLDVLVLQSTKMLAQRVTGLAGLLLLSVLGIGCAGSTQKPVPGLSVSSNSLNFQTVAVGQALSKTFTISNSGTAPVQISAMSVSNKEFALTGPSLPRTILPANSVSYTLTFAPTTSGLASANVDVSTDSVANARLIALAGKGAAAFANLAITPSSVSFGNLPLKSTTTQVVTLQNTGDSNLSLQGVTLSGSGFGYSDLSPGFALAPNQTITFKVWFAPKVAGPASATLTFLSSNLSSPETLSLSGDGISSSGPTSEPPSTGHHSVDLNWAASSSQVIGYRVYRSEISGGPYNPLNGTTINGMNYSDSSVAANTTYYYVVAAVNAAGTESSYSNQATAVVP
jgi:Abnormal spindle-like microcephaly-assoc'd, ASPM-SPD-2-Hydin